MGSWTEDAQPGFGDITRATLGSWIHPGGSQSGSPWLSGSWAPRPDPAPQQGEEALGMEPRRGGSRTAPAPRDHCADADSAARGSGGLSGRILPPGRCLRLRWLVSRREQPFKGHCQRAALTTSAHICLRSEGRADSERRSAAPSPPPAPCPGRILPPPRCCADLGTMGMAGPALSPHPVPTPQHLVQMLPWVRESKHP